VLDRFGDGCVHLAIHAGVHTAAHLRLQSLGQLHRGPQRLGADGGINARHHGAHGQGAIQRQLNTDRPFQHGFIVCGDETVPKTPLEITKARGQRSTVSTRSSS
jgi:hypothetical protein